ncbi:MAG: type II secretion system F family protein [Acidimicrobiales bacterium]
MSELLGSINPIILVCMLGAGLGLVLYTVLSQAEEKSSLRATLRQLDDYEQIEDVREQELLAPLSERLFGPVAEFLAKAGARFNPPEYVESVRKKHLTAGISSPDAIERFLATRILGFVFIPFWLIFMVVVNPLDLGGIKLIAMLGLGAMVGALGPVSQLNKKVEARQKEIQRTLPDTMDLLVISVEAGLGFEQALDRVIVNVPGALSDEFSRVLGESRAGSTRADALRAMDVRCDSPEVRSFVLAMIQADTFGVSIGRVLRSQADEMRIKRRQRAQEMAQKAPVKMLIPMVFCIFPALFVVVLGPAIINISKAF